MGRISIRSMKTEASVLTNTFSTHMSFDRDSLPSGKQFASAVAQMQIAADLAKTQRDEQLAIVGAKNGVVSPLGQLVPVGWMRENEQRTEQLILACDDYASELLVSCVHAIEDGNRADGGHTTTRLHIPVPMMNGKIRGFARGILHYGKDYAICPMLSKIQEMPFRYVQRVMAGLGWYLVEVSDPLVGCIKGLSIDVRIYLHAGSKDHPDFESKPLWHGYNVNPY